MEIGGPGGRLIGDWRLVGRLGLESGRQQRREARVADRRRGFREELLDDMQLEYDWSKEINGALLRAKK